MILFAGSMKGKTVEALLWQVVQYPFVSWMLDKSVRFLP
jgi:hypothetical protein